MVMIMARMKVRMMARMMARMMFRIMVKMMVMIVSRMKVRMNVRMMASYGQDGQYTDEDDGKYSDDYVAHTTLGGTACSPTGSGLSPHMSPRM